MKTFEKGGLIMSWSEIVELLRRGNEARGEGLNSLIIYDDGTGGIYKDNGMLVDGYGIDFDCDVEGVVKRYGTPPKPKMLAITLPTSEVESYARVGNIPHIRTACREALKPYES